jgi:transposase
VPLKSSTNDDRFHARSEAWLFLRDSGHQINHSNGLRCGNCRSHGNRKRWRLLLDDFHRCLEKLSQKTLWLFHSSHSAHCLIPSESGEPNTTFLLLPAASIDIKRRKRAKTDRIDVESLVRKLVRYSGGEGTVWSVVRVPSPEAEAARQIHRDIGVLQREQQQHRVRIQSLLFTQGIDVAVTPKLLRDLSEIRCWNGQPLPGELQERIRREYARLGAVEQDLLVLRKQQKTRLKKERTAAMDKIRLLQQLCGIAIKSSWVFVMELFGWRQFQNRREVASALGLTPMPYQSGESARDQGISRAGNRRVRAMAIEIAWGWLRYQPQSRLSQWYQQRFGGGGPRIRRIGIVAMARRLMIDLWRYVDLGILPPGARMKASVSR